jgi:replicative DNA helicase
VIPQVGGPQVAPALAGRVVPHDLEAEQSVLGALMLDHNAVATVRDVLEPGDFYAEKHRHIYSAALDLSDRGEPIDPITLRAQLERAGTLSRSGGVEYIAELSIVTPTAASVRHYADIVVQQAIRRRLIEAGGDVAQLGFDEGLPVQEAMDRAEQRVFRISEQRRTTEATHIAPVLKETWSQLETLLGGQKFITGVPTNFSELDNVTQGLQPGELIILAARPSVGKTSLALNLARNAAVLGKKAVAVFSLEMSKESLVQRLLCSEAHVDSFLLKTGQADAAAFSRIAQAMDRLTQAELWIDDTPALSISAMRSRARRMRAQHGISLVIVDYLQLMHGGRQESRVQEVSDISSGLKSIAKELQIPILALSQLSRESERRTDRRPQLSDLRDSGCLVGSTPVFLPDEGRCRPIADLVGRSGFRVLALDTTTWKLTPRQVLRAFPTGHRPVFDLTTRLGRSIRATANHKFLTLQGWKHLDELAPGDHIALPAGASTAAADPLQHVASRGSAGTALVQRPTRTTGDVYWDRVGGIEAAGNADVYDLTVEELHNFVAADMVVHNSIEQDADIVLFLYREGMHNQEVDKSVTQLIVAKNRNGPVRDIDLVFIAEQTAFREPYRGRPE